jgi:hypothetical protein
VLGAFHSRLLGWEVTARDGAGRLQLRNPEGGMGLNIQAEATYEPPVWPEQHQPADRDRTRLRIMLDPAGHPFCLFVDGE